MKTRSIIQVLRPRQWLKNVLVLAAPLAAGVMGSIHSIIVLILTFLSFCFLASFGYVINDWVDKAYDANHPTKFIRPFASNKLSFNHFLSIAIFLLMLFLAISTLLSFQFLVISILYTLSTLSYSFYLKHIPVIEMVWVSIGFLLRALAGAAAFNIPVSEWFLIVISFGALFLVATKRMSELLHTESTRARYVVSQYSTRFLELVMGISISISLAAYSLWAFGIESNFIYAKISVLPVVIGILRYAWFFESGDGESPEKLLLIDKVIPICALLAGLLIAMAVYGPS